MKEQLAFLKAGTMAKSMNAEVGLVSFRGGIASTFDGITSCTIPLDFEHDLSVRLETLSRAVAVLGEGFKIRKLKASLQLSNEGAKINVPFIENGAAGYAAPKGSKIDVPSGFMDAVRSVLPFSEPSPRDFTACININEYGAYATSGTTLVRYPLDSSFLGDRTLTIDAQALAAIVKMNLDAISFSDSTFSGYSGGQVITVGLSACKFPAVDKMFMHDSGAPVEVEAATLAACRTVASMDSAPLPTLTFSEGYVSTGGNDPDCIMKIQEGFGAGKFGSPKIIAVLSRSQTFGMISGQPCNFYHGKLHGVTIGMREA